MNVTHYNLMIIWKTPCFCCKRAERLCLFKVCCWPRLLLHVLRYNGSPNNGRNNRTQLRENSCSKTSDPTQVQTRSVWKRLETPHRLNEATHAFRRLWLTISNSVYIHSAGATDVPPPVSPADSRQTPLLPAGPFSLSSFIWLVIFGWTLVHCTTSSIHSCNTHTHTHRRCYWLFEFVLVKFC